MSDTNTTKLRCKYCLLSVNPAKESHFHRVRKGVTAIYHADCWQREFNEMCRSKIQQAIGGGK